MPKRNHPGLCLALIILFSIAFTSCLSGGTSHEITGTLSYSGGAGTPSSVTFTAYITSRTGEVLTQSSSGCSYNSGSGQWTVECGSFATQWSAGEVLHINFADGGTGGVASDDVTLSSGGSDNGGTSSMPCPNITISPSSLDFDEVEVGDTKDLTLTIGNNGNATLQVSDLDISGNNASQFSIVSGNAPFSVASGGTHAVIVRFTPAFDCGKWATLSIHCNDPDDSSPDCDLEGKGCGADIYVNNPSHDFGLVPVGSISEHTFRISNYGERDCIVSSTSISGSGDFTIVSGGGSFTMPHHSDRDLVVRFTSSSEGGKSATISMDNNDPLDDPLVLSLSGTGAVVSLALIQVNHTRWDYGSVAVGSFKDETFTVQNTGSADLQVVTTNIAGGDPEYFHIVSGGAPFSLSPGGSRDVVIRFAPTQETWARDLDALFRIESNAANKNPVIIDLEGRSGIPKMEVAARSHDYGEVFLDTPTSWVFTIENEGWERLNVTEISIRGDNFSEFAVTDGHPPFVVWRNYPKEVRITFQPVSAGQKSAEIIIVGDDPNDPSDKVIVTGVGVEAPVPGQPNMVLSSQAIDFGEVSVDSSAIQELLVINNGESELEILSMSVSGDDGFSAARLASDKGPAMAITSDADTMTIAAGDTEHVAVTFSPDSAGDKQATLMFQSNDPDEETVEIGLSGTGIANDPVPEPDPELVLQQCYPPSQAASVPVNVKIQFAINGLVNNHMPLEVTVNGECIISNTADQTGGQAQIKMNGNGCRVIYDPVDPFEENSEVTVFIQCGEIDTSYCFHTGQCENQHLTGGIVTQNGGLVTCDSTGLDIEVPEGAVEDTVEISIGLVSDTPELPEGVHGMGLSYHFGPEGFTFQEPVTIHLPYTEEDLLNANVTDPMDLQIYYYLTMTGEWILLEVLGADENDIYVQVDQFCYLTMGAVPEQSTGLMNNTDAQSRTMTLFQNYPNPFNPETHIPFYIPEPGHVRLEIYNAKGQLIRLLLDEVRESGHHQVLWNGMDDQSVSVGSGVYYYMIYCRDRTITGKAVLVK